VQAGNQRQNPQTLWAGRRKKKACTAVKLAKDQRIRDMINAIKPLPEKLDGVLQMGSPCARSEFTELDKFIRRRLRSAITGRYADGWWHIVLPNDLMGELGLLNLVELYNAHTGDPALPPAKGVAD